MSKNKKYDRYIAVRSLQFRNLHNFFFFFVDALQEPARCETREVRKIRIIYTLFLTDAFQEDAIYKTHDGPRIYTFFSHIYFRSLRAVRFATFAQFRQFGFRKFLLEDASDEARDIRRIYTVSFLTYMNFRSL